MKRKSDDVNLEGIPLEKLTDEIKRRRGKKVRHPGPKPIAPAPFLVTRKVLARYDSDMDVTLEELLRHVPAGTSYTNIKLQYEDHFEPCYSLCLYTSSVNPNFEKEMRHFNKKLLAWEKAHEAFLQKKRLHENHGSHTR